jgi:hypothetical protein
LFIHWHISCKHFAARRHLAALAAEFQQTQRRKPMAAPYPVGPAENVCADEPRHWPVFWSAVWVGALAALAVALITGLAGVAVGAQIVGPGEHMVSWRKVHFGGIAWAVCSTFVSFVVGGWVAGRIVGHPHSESGMLHGAIAWLVAVPILVAIASLGAGGLFGAWYTGLAGAPWAAAPHGLTGIDAYALARNNALGALTALLVGLIGSVIGGWMASGEPMTVFHYRTRKQASAIVMPTPSNMKTLPTA